jgi:hypothetical protein
MTRGGNQSKGNPDGGATHLGATADGPGIDDRGVMQGQSPGDAGWSEGDGVPPAARDMIPVTQSRMHVPAPEHPVLPRRSALVIEILSFVLIAFLVVSALLFHLAAPSTLISGPSSVSVQLPPKPAEPALSPPAVADAAPRPDFPVADPATTASVATEPAQPPAAAEAALPEVQPQAGPEAPDTEPPAAEVAALPPAAAPGATGAAPEEMGETSPAPAPAEEAASLPLPAEATEALIRRGDELLGTGDIVAARSAYERAAAGGNRVAATGVAKTYDPVFLAQSGVRGLRGDAARAALWYGKAAAAGDREAQQRLRRLRVQYPQ